MKIKVTKKNLYLLLLLIISLLGITLIPSYAKFASNYTTEDDIVGIALDFNIGITNIEEYEEITIKSGEYEIFNVEIQNASNSTAYYGVWYNNRNNNSNISIGRLEGTAIPTSGSIATGSTNTVSIIIYNDSTTDATIEIGVASSETSTNDIKYLDGKQLITDILEQRLTNVFTQTIMAPNAISDENIDFSKTSEATSTNGIYMVSETANDANPIYYYRGDVDNNLIFADTCWKVVRTTETDGLKLIYNGTPTNGQCTGSNSILGSKAFNSWYDSLAYVGYMYSDLYYSSYIYMNGVTDTYYYGNDVTYSNGTYTLTDTISSSSWSSIYNGGLNYYHYTCFSTGTTCDSVYYIYLTSSYAVEYITLTGGNKVEDALTEMLGADDNNTANYNTTSSIIKGSNTTEGTLDYWYYTNIEQKGYSSYIEDTVWCNDRSISSLNGWNPDGGNTTKYLYFSTYNRVWTNANPSLTCARNIDSFTVDEKNGNGDLDYPVGLLTADEIMLAGADNQYTDNYSYYLYNGDAYWIGSPEWYEYISEGDGGARVFMNWEGGYFDGAYSFVYGGVRPSISLKPGFSLTGNGDGTVENPYVVE